jgi:hypothetical protein
MSQRYDTLTFWTARIEYLQPHIGRLIKDAKNRVLAARSHASNHVH